MNSLLQQQSPVRQPMISPTITSSTNANYNARLTTPPMSPAGGPNMFFQSMNRK